MNGYLLTSYFLLQMYAQYCCIFCFHRFGALQPVYINLIRDPLSRLVSSYYYRRFGDHREGHRTWHFEGTEKEKNQVCSTARIMSVNH